MKVIGIATLVLLAAGAALEGLFNAAQQQPVTTIEEAKQYSLQVQRDLVQLADGLAVAPVASQPETIGERELSLYSCGQQGYYRYPGATAVVFLDAASVTEFDQRITTHLLESPEWEPEPSAVQEGIDSVTFRHTNGTHVWTTPITDPNNLRVVISVSSPCVELPPDFPKAGGPKY